MSYTLPNGIKCACDRSFNCVTCNGLCDVRDTFELSMDGQVIIRKTVGAVARFMDLLKASHTVVCTVSLSMYQERGKTMSHNVKFSNKCLECGATVKDSTWGAWCSEKCLKADKREARLLNGETDDEFLHDLKSHAEYTLNLYEDAIELKQKKLINPEVLKRIELCKQVIALEL